MASHDKRDFLYWFFLLLYLAIGFTLGSVATGGC